MASYKVYSVQPKVVRECFEDEVVIINLENGNYYSLNGTGAEIWRELEAGGFAEAVAAALVARYEAPEATIRQAVESFIRQLEEHGLVAGTESMSSDTPVVRLPVESRAVFELPELAVFSDMQDLLLLDPIHDVDESGWPARPAGGS